MRLEPHAEGAAAAQRHRQAPPVDEECECFFSIPFLTHSAVGCFFFLVVVVGFKICGFTIIFSPIFKFSKHSLLTSKLSPSADVAASAPSKLESDQPNIIIAERSYLRMNHLNSFFSYFILYGLFDANPTWLSVFRTFHFVLCPTCL